MFDYKTKIWYISIVEVNGLFFNKGVLEAASSGYSD